jgi:Arc/MetJ-type ribon-helix-helix transcriptional regulator
MDVTLPADLRKQVEQELASGRYGSRDELIEQAVRQFFDERRRGEQRLDALRRIGQAVDQAGLYERVLTPRSGPCSSRSAVNEAGDFTILWGSDSGARAVETPEH